MRGSRASGFGGALEPLTEVRVAYFEKERRELVGLNYAEPVRSPLSSAEPGSARLQPLLRRAARRVGGGRRRRRAAVSAGRARCSTRWSAGAPVEPLARYFECWLLRLQGVYPPDAGRCRRGALAFLDGVATGRRRATSAALGASDRVLRELELVHRTLIAMHLEKELKSDRVLHDLRRLVRAVTFQDLILKLSAFWASHGCLLQQPLDLEVGAGTSHPETLFRVLGPKPWSVAYVQPSRRPDDGRFGQNPNRLFKHHQYQVILKPSPDEVQQLYLDSLEACGINPRQHDIRFEEDNWESPTLGAWGIGWQVMLDGLEITQFTYFQQVGGIDLAPISCEITYGLERIAMFLQKVDNVFDLEWGGGVKYGEVRLREEIEQSKYAFNQDTGIDAERIRRSIATCSTRTSSSASSCSTAG